MFKNKKVRLAFVGVTIFSMLAVYAQVPVAMAASLTNAKDTLSDSSSLNASTSHSMEFTSSVDSGANMKYVVTLDKAFDNITAGNVACPDGATATVDAGAVGVTDWVVTCTTALDPVEGAKTLKIYSVTNPAAGSYPITIETKTSGNSQVEVAQVRVYVLSSVTMTATVPATLTFSLAQVDANTSVNGTTTNATGTPTTVAFGTLTPGVTKIAAQQLAVSTNATGGFTVTVKQDHELRNAAGSNINSFRNSQTDTGTTSPEVWAAPSKILDSTNTYGHMGLTTDDADGAVGTLFSGSKFAGLSGTSAMEVMSHDDPADGTTQNKGMVKVAYAVQISELQEAGDYSAALTYICTPTY